MADQPRYLNEGELEDALSRLSRQIHYPPTPDLASTVRKRISDTPRRQPPFWHVPPSHRRARVLAVTMLLLALLIASVLTLSPATRTAVADRFGFRGLLFTTERERPTPIASPAGEFLGLGNRMTLDEARARVPFQVLTPTGDDLNNPDEVYLSYPPASGQVALVYHERDGLPTASGYGVALLLTQFQGQIEPGFFVKGLGPNTRVTPITVNAGRGFWIEGEPHVFYYRDASGQVHDELVRLVGNVLVWEQDDVIVRIEGAISMDEALRLAETLR